MREERILQGIKLLIGNYNFDEPFSQYLNRHFRKNPSMGSRDRNNARELCFNYFRLGKALQDLSFEERLGIATYLCGNHNSTIQLYLLNKYLDFFNDGNPEPPDVKLKHVQTYYPSFRYEEIFPMQEFLSEGLNNINWFLSFLNKPKVWIRMKKGKRVEVISELKQLAVPFDETENDQVLSFSQGTNLENLETFKQGFFEVQDVSSQKVIDFIQLEPHEHWWDACAGSGGKSLLLADKEPTVTLTATDIRSSILKNYSIRMKKSGFHNFRTQVADLKGGPVFPEQYFDGILVDVPCSGSGTWSRTPEWLMQDCTDLIRDFYVPLQRKIVSNVLPALKIGRTMLYVTCSAFKKENEENVQYFTDNLPVKLEESTYIEGYRKLSDTFFVARFIRVS